VNPIFLPFNLAQNASASIRISLPWEKKCQRKVYESRHGLFCEVDHRKFTSSAHSLNKMKSDHKVRLFLYPCGAVDIEDN
jgi:hypothetical protein